jgi:cation transport ATPase
VVRAFGEWRKQAISCPTCGVLCPTLGILSIPMIAATAMPYRSVSVIGNAHRIRCLVL